MSGEYAPRGFTDRDAAAATDMAEELFLAEGYAVQRLGAHDIRVSKPQRVHDGRWVLVDQADPENDAEGIVRRAVFERAPSGRSLDVTLLATLYFEPGGDGSVRAIKYAVDALDNAVIRMPVVDGVHGAGPDASPLEDFWLTTWRVIGRLSAEPGSFLLAPATDDDAPLD